MERILLLESPGIREKFRASTVIPPTGISVEQYVERRVLEAINDYNPKLNITRVVYLSLNSQFPQVQSSKSTGLIVEDINIQHGEQQKYRQLGCYIWNNAGEWFARKIIIYVYITPPTDGGRNSLVSQNLFPSLIDYMEDYIDSPSYTFANHPMYLVNIINKVITAESILKPMAGIISSGIEYVEVFNNSLDSSRVPKDPERFVKEYESNCRPSSSTFSNSYYEVDFHSKTLRIKTDRLVVGDYLENSGGYVGFNGSAEKFYWIQILPIFMMASKSGYSIDYSELENFYNSHLVRFNPSSAKLERFSVLLKFIRKLTIT